MIRIAICDDEKKILDEVSGYIKKYADMFSICIFYGVLYVLTLIGSDTFPHFQISSRAKIRL